MAGLMMHDSYPSPQNEDGSNWNMNFTQTTKTSVVPKNTNPVSTDSTPEEFKGKLK